MGKILICIHIIVLYAFLSGCHGMQETMPEEKESTIHYLRQESGAVHVAMIDFDIEVVFDPCGINAIYALQGLYWRDQKTASQEYEDIPIITDWIGPFIVRYEGDIAPETIEARFTGGWHGSNGDGTGAPTASTKAVKVLVNGTNAKEDGLWHEADSVQIVVTNEIEAYNHKEPVIEEIVTYTLTNDKIKVTMLGKALKPITIERYYGLQTQNNWWQLGVEYVLDALPAVMAPIDTSSQSGAIDEGISRRFYLLDDQHMPDLEVYMSPEGLGDFNYLDGQLSSAFTVAYGKSYFNLVNGKAYRRETDETFAWSGHYRWLPTSR